MESLVDLHYKQQLAEEQGITLSEDELAAALAADGTSPEARRIAALVVQPLGSATGQSTPEDVAEARAKAEEALAALKAGTPIADLVDEYSPATAAQDGDIGYRTLDDLRGIDAAWAETLFGLDEGGITEVTDTAVGQLIGVVTDIVPETPDPAFLAAVNEQVGEGVHRRNVEMEALGAKLEEKISADAVAKDYAQVRLAEILVAGDTLVAPEDDQPSVRASHILYRPEPADATASPAPGTSPAPGRLPGPEASPAPAVPGRRGLRTARRPASPAAAASPRRPPLPSRLPPRPPLPRLRRRPLLTRPPRPRPSRPTTPPGTWPRPRPMPRPPTCGPSPTSRGAWRPSPPVPRPRATTPAAAPTAATSASSSALTWCPSSPTPSSMPRTPSRATSSGPCAVSSAGTSSSSTRPAARSPSGWPRCRRPWPPTAPTSPPSPVSSPMAPPPPRAARSAGRSWTTSTTSLAAGPHGHRPRRIDRAHRRAARLRHLPEAGRGHAAPGPRRCHAQGADRLRRVVPGAAHRSRGSWRHQHRRLGLRRGGRRAGRLIAGHGWARRLHLVHGALRVGQVHDRGGPRAPAAGARSRGDGARW